jgi:chromosomal replication initiator protein
MGKSTLTYYVIPGLKMRKVRFQRVIMAVAESFDISTRLMMSTSRQRELVLARNMCMYIMKTYFNMTLKEIGKAFSRDHTTVIHAIKMFQQDREVNEQYELTYHQIKQKLELRKGTELEK